jgi:fluoride exporter
MSLYVWLALGLLGGAGAVLRFAVDRATSGWATVAFPAGTFAVNISGACLLGVLSVARLSATTTLLLGAATLGSYTTFSTWMLESHRLGQDGRSVLMAANVSLSLVLGLAACVLGRYVGGVL